MNALLRWLFERWIRGQVDRLNDVARSQLPVTFYFQVGSIRGRIVVDTI